MLPLLSQSTAAAAAAAAVEYRREKVRRAPEKGARRPIQLISVARCSDSSS